MIPDAQKAENVFDRALDFEPSERAAFLAGACGNDVNLRRRVQDLLLAHEAKSGFLPAGKSLSAEDANGEPPVSTDRHPAKRQQPVAGNALVHDVGRGRDVAGVHREAEAGDHMGVDACRPLSGGDALGADRVTGLDLGQGVADHVEDGCGAHLGSSRVSLGSRTRPATLGQAVDLEGLEHSEVTAEPVGEAVRAPTRRPVGERDGFAQVTLGPGAERGQVGQGHHRILAEGGDIGAA